MTIGGLQWLDYALAGPRRTMAMVTEQKRRYLDPDARAVAYYAPLLAGFRRAVSSPDRSTVLDRVVAKAAQGRELSKPVAYRSASDGFLRLLPRGATGVPVAQAAWRDGDLSIVLRHMLGLRLRDDTKFLVAPYCKKPELSQEVADVLLHLMDALIPEILPGATAVVYDTRHARRYKLGARTNRRSLDALVRSMASGYVRHWHLAA
ncbi:hypothetical protein BAY61_01380 [Prauserella marina]|nr:hypothetical protein BAY61_01380 [Prauserella marina]